VQYAQRNTRDEKMPTYEYVCDSCGHRLEKFQSITASPLRKCPACGENKLKRLIGAGAGVIFKGSGFYETDYRSEGYKKAKESETKTTTPAKEASDKKTEAKKTETKESKPAKKDKSPPTEKK
jgi:putative FmdB family regulatory protein